MAKLWIALLVAYATVAAQGKSLGLEKREAEWKEVEAELDKLDKAVEELGKDADDKKVKGLKGMLAETKKYLKDNRDDNIAKVGTAAKSVVTVLQTIKTSKDPYKVAAAITATVADFSAMIPPPAGLAISSVLSVASAVLGLGAKKVPTMSDVVNAAIKTGLNEQYVNELKGEINGVTSAIDINLGIILLFSEKIRSGEFAKASESQKNNDMDTLSAQVKWSEGVKLLGTLKNYIQDSIANVNPKPEKDNEKISAKKVKADVGLIRAYAQLTALRFSMLHHLRVVYNESGTHYLADDAVEVVYNVTRREAWGVLNFLEKADEKSIVLTSGYSDIESEPIYKFAKSIEIEERIKLPSGCIKIKSAEEGRPDDDAYVGIGNGGTYLLGKEGLAANGGFHFMNPEYTATHTKTGTQICWQGHCLCAKDGGVDLSTNCPKPNFNVVPFGKDGLFYIVPAGKPGQPMVAQDDDGMIRLGDHANPGTKAYWKLESC